MMSDSFSMLSYGWHLHGLFVGVALFGAVLLLIWLVKEGKREKIMTIVWTTLVVGILGLLLTSPWGGRYWSMMAGNLKGMMNQGQMMGR